MPEQFDFASGALPSIEELSCFVAVVEGGTFAAAAQRLGVARSNISRRVSQLEERLDARLLHRTTRSVELSEVGRRYYDEVREAMGQLQSASACVHEIHARPGGRLRMSAPSDVAPFVAALIADFRKVYPEVELEVELTQRRVDLINEGFDLALRAGTLEDSSLIARSLDTTRFGLFASSEYLADRGTPSSVQELVDHDFVLFGARSFRQTLELNSTDGRPLQASVSGAVSVSDFVLMRLLLRRGLGIGFLPMLESGAPTVTECGTEILTRVLPELHGPTGRLCIVYPSSRLVSAKLRAFCDFALQWRHTEQGRKAASGWAVASL